MKKIFTLLSLIFALGLLSASAQPGKEETKVSSTQENLEQSSQDTLRVAVYYFHATRRCVTCEAVEAVTREALASYYGNTIRLQTINRDEEKDHPLIAKHKVAGQTLLIIKGDEVINLTNTAFLNARTNPEKLKAKIKSSIDELL